MAKSVNAILLVLAAVLLVPFASYAAGLGTFTVRSALGQPLDAEIEVVALRPGEELQVRLASRDAYGAAGVDFSPVLQGARFAVERRDGRTVIRVRTTEPVNDPFLSVLVEVQLPSGRLARQYTVLVDPAEFRRAAAPTPAAPPVAAAPAPAVAPPTAAPAPAVAPSIAAPTPARTPARAVVATPTPAPAPAATTVAVAPAAPSAPPVAIAPAPTQSAPPVAVAPLHSAPVQPPVADAPTIVATPAVVAAPAPQPVAAAPAPAPTIPMAAPVEAPAQSAAATVTPPASQTVPTPTLVPAAPQTPERASVTPASTAPVVAAAREPQPASAPSVSAVAAAPSVQPASPTASTPHTQSADASDTYRIRRGDTLGAIARKWRPEGVTHEQMLLGLYQTNRPAFIRDNINLIRAGATLFIPGREDVLAISAAEAAREVRTHMVAFGRYRETAVSVGLGSERITQAQREVISRRVGVKRSSRAL